MRRRLVAGMALLVAGAAGLQAQDKQQRRRDYFRQQLVYPFEDVSAAYAQELARIRIERSRQTAAIASAIIGSTAVPLGPQGLLLDNAFYFSSAQLDVGRISQVAIHPTNRDTWYVATAGGGVWKTTNAGASWVAITDNECSLNAGAVAIDPVNPNIVYVGTGEGNTASPGCGMLRSANGGSSWSVHSSGMFLLSGNLRPAHAAIVIDPATAGSTTSTTLLMGGTYGVFRSTNSGASWTAVLRGLFADNVIGRPGDPNVIYAGVTDDVVSGGVYRSADKGATWSSIGLPSGVVPSDIARVGLAVSAAQPGKLWLVFVGNDQRLIGGWVWDESTGLFTAFNATAVHNIGNRGTFGLQSTYNLVLAVHPTNPSRIFLGGVRMYRSDDGGATWRQVAENIHVDWHAFAFDHSDPRRILAGSDGGVYYSTDGGDTWTSRNYGLAITQYYPGIALHPTDAGVIVGGSQDNGTQRSFGMPIWEGVTGGDGGFAAINYANPSIVWSTCQWLPGPCIYRNGFFQSSASSVIPTSDRAQFIPPLVMDPVTPTTLYFGTHRVWRTANDGGQWSAVSPDLTNGSGSISAIAVAPSDPATIYAGTNNGLVRVTRDGGTTWNASGTGLPNRYVTDVLIDPTDPNVAIATHAGFNAAHVFRTADGGATWTSISGNLPDLPVYSIAWVPSEALLIIGTLLGVYQSADLGATWQPGPPGIPLVPVRDLAHNPTTSIVVAATHGRGMFKIPVGTASPVLRGDVDRDGSVGPFDAVLVQRALIGRALGSNGEGEPYVAMPRGDANCDGRLTAVDALIIIRASVGLSTGSSCVGTAARLVP